MQRSSSRKNVGRSVPHALKSRTNPLSVVVESRGEFLGEASRQTHMPSLQRSDMLGTDAYQCGEVTLSQTSCHPQVTQVLIGFVDHDYIRDFDAENSSTPRKSCDTWIGPAELPLGVRGGTDLATARHLATTQSDGQPRIAQLTGVKPTQATLHRSNPTRSHLVIRPFEVAHYAGLCKIEYNKLFKPP